MHLFLLVPLFLLIFSIGFAIHGTLWDSDVAKITAFFLAVIFPFAFLISFSPWWIIKQYPVEYTTEAITSKIFVHTKYGEFESDKKVDFDNWTKNLPGYIIQKCNAWGNVEKSYFTTEPIEK